MKKLCLGIMLCLASFATFAQSRITLDPDDYADRSILNTAIPQVRLVTAGNNNLPIPFDVTANVSTPQITPPTGNSIFGHVNIPFWYTDRRLRMDFNGLVSFLSLDFQGSSALNAEAGYLAVYGADSSLLGTYTTSPRLTGEVETMSITRSTADIAWAIAYSIPAGSPVGSFGRLDHLVFSEPVPEASSVVLLSAGLAACLCFRVVRKQSDNHHQSK